MIIDDPTRRGDATSVRAICFPRDDAALVDRVQEILDGWVLTHTDPSPEGLAQVLAPLYPQVAVSVREQIAELWETGEPTWYVYRDGSLLSSLDEVDGSERAGP